MKLILLTIASAREEWSDLAVLTYQKKISHFHSFEKVQIRPPKNSRAQALQKTKEESDKILEYLKSDDYVVLFDERGTKLDSVQFSKKMEKVLQSGKKRCVFVIGGAFGVTPELRQRAELVASFSDMVFNHLLAEVMAVEQIYRSFTIIKNIPYHNI